MSTPDWMRQGDELEKPLREGVPLAGLIAWALGLVIAANLALAAMRLLA